MSTKGLSGTFGSQSQLNHQDHAIIIKDAVSMIQENEWIFVRNAEKNLCSVQLSSTLNILTNVNHNS